MKKRPTPRPKETGTLIGVRLQRDVLDPLDAYAATIGADASRPQAVRAILLDWLTAHGFIKSV